MKRFAQTLTAISLGVVTFGIVTACDNIGLGSEVEKWRPHMELLRTYSNRASTSDLHGLMPQDAYRAMTVQKRFFAKSGRREGVRKVTETWTEVEICGNSKCMTAQIPAENYDVLLRASIEHRNWIEAALRCAGSGSFCGTLGWVKYGEEYDIDLVGAVYDYLDNAGGEAIDCDVDLYCQQLVATLGPLPPRP